MKSAALQKMTEYPIGGLQRLADKSLVGAMLQFTRLGFALEPACRQAISASLDGKTALITGATSGIGYEAALGIAKLGARTVFIARNPDKADKIRARLAVESGNADITYHIADMRRMADVRSAATAVATAEPDLHILVNNAGALFRERGLTEDGFENTLAVNLLSPFVLTGLLIPKLRASGPARIINVSSGGMYTQPIDLTDLNYENTPYDGPKAYARAKRGIVILTELWSHIFRDSGIVVNAMHPGWVDTPGLAGALPGFHAKLGKLLRTPAQGADTIVWLAADSSAGNLSGKFWLDRRPRPTDIFKFTRSTEKEKQALWKALEKMAGGAK